MGPPASPLGYDAPLDPLRPQTHLEPLSPLDDLARVPALIGHRDRSHHSITSSARATSSGGRVRPSMRAVLRLTARSNLVGSSTGRSAGLSGRCRDPPDATVYQDCCRSSAGRRLPSIAEPDKSH